MTKYIHLPSEVKKEIERTFKVSKATLWNALNYMHYSSKAKMLRAAAIQRGGVIYDPTRCHPGVRPNCVTTFETADNTMNQQFGNRVLLVADLTTGDVVTYVDGIAASKAENITLAQLRAIQQQAQLKANELKNSTR